MLALLFVLAVLSGCGSDEIGGEIPPSNAEELNASLEKVRFAVESSPPLCDTARTAADQFVADVNELPQTAGADLKEALREAGDNLRVLVDEQCASTATTGPTGPQSTSSSTTSSDTTTTSSTTDTTSTTTSSTEETQPQDNGNGGGPPGGGPPGGGGTDGGTGGTGGGTGAETGD